MCLRCPAPAGLAQDTAVQRVGSCLFPGSYLHGVMAGGKKWLDQSRIFLANLTLLGLLRCPKSAAEERVAADFPDPDCAGCRCGGACPAGGPLLPRSRNNGNFQAGYTGLPTEVSRRRPTFDDGPLGRRGKSWPSSGTREFPDLLPLGANAGKNPRWWRKSPAPAVNCQPYLVPSVLNQTGPGRNCG